MTQNNDDVKLLPCPMCKAGETHSQGKYIGGPTMSGKPQEPYSWEIRHWCENKDGKLPRTFITVTGRDEKQAVSAWNTRASLPTPADGVSGWQASRAAMMDDMRVAIEALEDIRKQGCVGLEGVYGQRHSTIIKRCDKALARLAKYEGGKQ